MPKGTSDSLVTKIALGAIILVSVLLMGIIAYDRIKIESNIEIKQQELKSYENSGLGTLTSEKTRLERQLKSLQNADQDLSGMLFAKPASKMSKEIGDPLKFKEELYKVQNKVKEDGASINFQFPFWLGFERYEHDIPNAADLTLRVKQLDIIKEVANIALAAKIPEIANIEFLEVKKVLAENNKEMLFMDFPVKVVLKCKNENLVAFMHKLSVADIPFRADSFKIKVSEEEGEATGDLTAEFVIIASILPAEKI